jgi:transketolase
MAYVLWTGLMRHNPGDPRWTNRDRFVLSAGHGSSLLYALLHLCGYDLSLEDIKAFRQWGSKTPGHPEYNPDLGIECTTGPLGQGFAMGVGMALAERFLAARFNRRSFPLVDHFTYGIVSDGDLMEGVASEAASFAGHFGLGKLIYLYDDNHISIEGNTSITFSEDTAARFEAYRWHVQRVEDGNSVEAIREAVINAQAETDRPSLIMVRTHIGYGSPKQDSEKAHGEPLGEEGLKATKEFFGWPREPRFYVPDEVRAHVRSLIEDRAESERQWRDLFSRFAKEFPEDAESFERESRGEFPPGWVSAMPVFKPEDGPIATRAASGKVLNAFAGVVTNMLGGSGDLAPSTKTIIDGSEDQSLENRGGRNIRFGIREHAMGAIVNGMALHGGVIPYAATFLVFADYMRPALRLASLMGTHSIFIFTHDSIGVGEDGPTHQPIEQVASLRIIPDLTVIRPADANETAVAWRVALERKKPVALILTRQKLPVLAEQSPPGEGAAKGGYVLADSNGVPDIILIAAGSEVHLAVEARTELDKEGVKARVVSMPSWELFAEQPAEYRAGVLPPDVKKRLAIEAGSPMGWSEWVGDEGDTVTIDHFGASAPGGEVMRRFGFTAENVTARARDLVKG